MGARRRQWGWHEKWQNAMIGRINHGVRGKRSSEDGAWDPRLPGIPSHHPGPQRRRQSEEPLPHAPGSSGSHGCGQRRSEWAPGTGKESPSRLLGLSKHPGPEHALAGPSDEAGPARTCAQRAPGFSLLGEGLGGGVRSWMLVRYIQGQRKMESYRILTIGPRGAEQ